MGAAVAARKQKKGLNFLPQVTRTESILGRDQKKIPPRKPSGGSRQNAIIYQTIKCGVGVERKARGVLSHSRHHPCTITFRIKMKIGNSSDFQIWQQVNMMSPLPRQLKNTVFFAFTLFHPSLPADCSQCSSQTHTPASATGTNLYELL